MRFRVRRVVGQNQYVVGKTSSAAASKKAILSRASPPPSPLLHWAINARFRFIRLRRRRAAKERAHFRTSSLKTISIGNLIFRERGRGVIRTILALFTVHSQRRTLPFHIPNKQRFSSTPSQGFKVEDLESSPGWWACTVATYYPRRPSNFYRTTAIKHNERVDENHCRHPVTCLHTSTSHMQHFANGQRQQYDTSLTAALAAI